MIDRPQYESQVLDHLGLVAGMFDELGIGDILDQATQQDPQTRDLTVGEAVKAMVLNGLGFVNQALYLVPMFFQNKPTYRLISPRVAPEQLNDDALGRTLDTLYAYGVTELYSLIAAGAAKRLGLTPTYGHLDTTSFHVDGRYNCDEPPSEGIVRLTQGYSRAHRPDLNQVMLELIVEHQAGIPLLMKPLSGNSSDSQEFGQIIRDHIAQLHSTYGTTYVVTDSALYSEDNLALLKDLPTKWITRVPGTLNEVKAALAQADPEQMVPLKAGYRGQTLTSTYGGVAQRWLLVESQPRRPQAQRTVNKRWLKHSETEIKAFQKLGRREFACEADARQALETFEQRLTYTQVQTATIVATPRYDKPGRPKNGEAPREMRYTIEGALGSPVAAHEQRVSQASCFVLATNELDASCLPPVELLDAYQGQQHVERGFRFLKSPEFLAASLYLKKPERIMALLMVMTVCLLVYAALEHRIRQALHEHGATFPNQKGKRIQNPTARWVFHYFVGIHVLCQVGEWPQVLNLTEEHGNLLKLLGPPYMQFYDVKYS
ncbi:MAG TPA: IS1634 family transposase [Candidatus Entotheonella sp.]